jgi:hypothetical protein
MFSVDIFSPIPICTVLRSSAQYLVYTEHTLAESVLVTPCVCIPAIVIGVRYQGNCDYTSCHAIYHVSATNDDYLPSLLEILEILKYQTYSKAFSYIQ